jgi:hypothetical protein
MLSAFLGMLVSVASLWGMWMWRDELMLVLRGLLPLCFFLGGLVAVIAGLSIFARPASDKRSGIEKK